MKIDSNHKIVIEYNLGKYYLISEGVLLFPKMSYKMYMYTYTYLQEYALQQATIVYSIVNISAKCPSAFGGLR